MPQKVAGRRSGSDDGGMNMLIDKFDDQWLDQLNANVQGAKDSNKTYLLIDGVFIPGFYRSVNAVLPSPDSTTLLFDSLPACSDATRLVSPFIAPYAPCNHRLQILLRQCSGWPMVSALETPEIQSELTARLAAWCVVQADNGRFNLRFPDTRRLAEIYEVLAEKQRMELSGPATRWSFVDRFGGWVDLKVMGAPSSTANLPTLDRNQFVQLVNASKVDEVVSILANRGYGITGRASRTYTTVSIALRSAKIAGLDPKLNVEWCEECLSRGVPGEESEILLRLA
jgi:hypothetical protein